VFINL